MTKAISMAIELDQNIMVTNMCLKFGEDRTNSFQELDRQIDRLTKFQHILNCNSV